MSPRLPGSEIRHHTPSSMIRTVIGRHAKTPPVTRACEWGESGIVTAHEHGLLSVFKNGQLLHTIQTPGQRIAFLRAVDACLYVSFYNGIFASYSLRFGILEQSVELKGPVAGVFLQENALVVWGIGTEVSFLNRTSLDVEKTLFFDSKPVRVAKDKRLAVVLRSGDIHWVSQDRVPSDPVSLAETTDQRPIMDAAPIDRGKWVCMQRDKWSIVQEIEGQFHHELNATAPNLFRGLSVSPHVSTFMITCDNGQLLLVENNNIQVLEPEWEPSNALRSLIYYKQRPMAITEDGTLFIGEIKDQIWAWTTPESPLNSLKATSKEPLGWVLSGHFGASNRQFGKFDKKCIFYVLYEAQYDIKSMVTHGTKTYLGLSNGSVDILDEKHDWKLQMSIPLLTMPITRVSIQEKTLLAWSDHTLAIYRSDLDFPLIIPSECIIKDVKLQSDSIYVNTREELLKWDLTTHQAVRVTHHLEFERPASTIVHYPFVLSDTNRSTLEDERVGFECITEDGHSSVTLLDPVPTHETAAAIYTLRCAHGVSLAKADEDLRAMHIKTEDFEELLVALDHRNESLCSSATTLFESLTDNKRMETLMKMHTIRPSLIISALYPTVPLGDWLKQSLDQLFAGSTTEKLVGLRILAHHMELSEFPFKVLGGLGIDTAVKNFVKIAAANSRATVINALRHELASTELNWFSLCVECVDFLLEDKIVPFDSADFITLIGAIAKAVHRTPSGKKAIRQLFARILNENPQKAAFNKQRQLMCIQSAFIKEGVHAIVWDLPNGHEKLLAASAKSGNSIKFSDDAKLVISGSATWRLPGMFASFFGANDVVQAE